jgi:hypothetical protein
MVVLEGARSIYSSNVRFGSKADIRSANTDVRYGPIAEVFWEGDDEVLNSRGGTVRDHRRLDATSERNLRKEPSIRLIATLAAWGVVRTRGQAH